MKASKNNKCTDSDWNNDRLEGERGRRGEEENEGTLKKRKTANAFNAIRKIP